MKRTSRHKVSLVTESLRAKDSGIGRVARLMAKALHELRIDGVTTKMISLNDQSGDVIDWPQIVACKGRRARFVWEIQRRAPYTGSFFYDSLSMGRAHFMGPGRFQSSLVFMHGIDVWENARKEHLSVARRATQLVTNSEYTRTRAMALHPGLEHAHVCWLATETDYDTPQRQVFTGPPVVLILSRIDMDSYKGHRELIDIWPSVVHHVPDAKLLIAGAGPGLAQIRRLVQQSPAEGNIEIMGFIKNEDLASLWKRTWVFAMPSRGEGFGLVYIEAMSHGIPVIASIHDAGQEVNVHGETGYNVNLNQPRELASALIELLTHPDKALIMGTVGYHRWKQYFTYRAFRQRFLPLIAHMFND